MKREKRKITAKNQVVARVMRANRSKHTGPELLLRKLLNENGVRNYRLFSKNVPGRPDIVFRSRKLAVFVHGCYWHHCPKCDFQLPKHNRAFWREKFERNRKRDARNLGELRSAGWSAVVVWEHEMKKSPEKAALRVKRRLDALE